MTTWTRDFRNLFILGGKLPYIQEKAYMYSVYTINGGNPIYEENFPQCGFSKLNPHFYIDRNGCEFSPICRGFCWCIPTNRWKFPYIYESREKFPISQCIFEPLYIGENLHPFLSEHLKGQCHEILDFFSLIKPIWVPDKQAKMVFLKN